MTDSPRPWCQSFAWRQVSCIRRHSAAASIRSNVQTVTAISSLSVGPGSCGHALRHSLGRSKLIRGSDGGGVVAQPLSRESAIRAGGRLERIDLPLQSGFTRCSGGRSHSCGLVKPAHGLGFSVETCSDSSGVRSLCGASGASVIGSRYAVAVAAPSSQDASQTEGQKQIGMRDHITYLPGRPSRRCRA